jgi:hypothetical protein
VPPPVAFRRSTTQVTFCVRGVRGPPSGVPITVAWMDSPTRTPARR